MLSPDSPIVSHSALATAAQCSRYILSRAHGEYTEYDVASVIVPAYFRLCQPVGLDPVMLIAQMIHETGNLTSWWAARPRRNPAGIGVTGQRRDGATRPRSGIWQWDGRGYVEGIAFADWAKESCPAHAGRILAYALRDEQATSAQLRLMAQALSFRPLPASYRGVAPTWRGLQGRWSVPGTDYASKIVAIATAIARS